MEHKVSRRSFLCTAAGVAAASRFLHSQQPAIRTPARVGGYDPRSAVSLVSGGNRRKNVMDSLAAIEDQILPVLRTRKYVVIKPNIVNTENQLASTHVDALQGIVDFLAPRFKGPVVIAESSAGYSTEGYDNFHYNQVMSEHKSQQLSLLDLNEEGKYEVIQVLNANLHPVPVRLAARLLDPEAYVICSGILKTHNTVVATLSIKNMTLGAPLHSARKETRRWNDKRAYHGGVRQTHFDIMLTAQKMRPFWGATVIDGFEGMEGEGPLRGTAVPSRIAIASTDFVSADRVGVEAMGVNPDWPGYLRYCAELGLGQYDLARIDLRGGVSIDSIRRVYNLHPRVQRQMEWLGPLPK